MLLDRGAEMHARDKYDNSPAFRACKERHVECLRLLVDAKANLDSVDKGGSTLACQACRHGDKRAATVECLKVLILAEADLTAYGYVQKSPLRLARNNRHSPACALLAVATWEPLSTKDEDELLEAVKRENLEMALPYAFSRDVIKTFSCVTELVRACRERASASSDLNDLRERAAVMQQMLVAMLDTLDEKALSRELLPWEHDRTASGKEDLLAKAVRSQCITLLASPPLKRMLHQRWSIVWPAAAKKRTSQSCGQCCSRVLLALIAFVGAGGAVGYVLLCHTESLPSWPPCWASFWAPFWAPFWASALVACAVGTAAAALADIFHRFITGLCYHVLLLLWSAVYPPLQADLERQLGESMQQAADDFFKDNPEPLVSGLKWRNVGVDKPSTGEELPANEGLANALKTKTDVEFTDVEWRAFGITDLRSNHVIQSGDAFFQPADEGAREYKLNYTLDGGEPDYKVVMQHTQHARKEKRAAAYSIFLSERTKLANEKARLALRAFPLLMPECKFALQTSFKLVLALVLTTVHVRAISLPANSALLVWLLQITLEECKEIQRDRDLWRADWLNSLELLAALFTICGIAISALPTADDTVHVGNGTAAIENATLAIKNATLAIGNATVAIGNATALSFARQLHGTAGNEPEDLDGDAGRSVVWDLHAPNHLGESMLALGVMLLWITQWWRVMLRSASLGHYVLMMEMMISDVLRFLLLMSGPMLGFAGALVVLFGNAEAIDEECRFFLSRDGDGGGGGFIARLFTAGRTLIELVEVMLGADLPFDCLHGSSMPFSGPIFLTLYLLLVVLLAINMLIGECSRTASATPRTRCAPPGASSDDRCSALSVPCFAAMMAQTFERVREQSTANCQWRPIEAGQQRRRSLTCACVP
jgi:hypothetical protein